MAKITVKDFLEGTFTDTKGGISSKRIVTFLAFNLLSLAFLLNLIWDISVVEFMFDGMMYIVAGGLGFTALEHFSPGSWGKNGKQSPEPIEEIVHDGVSVGVEITRD